MYNDFLPDMFYSQLQHDGGPQMLCRKSNLAIERDFTFEDCYM